MRALAAFLLAAVWAGSATGGAVLAARTLPAGTILTRADLLPGIKPAPDGGDFTAVIGLETRRAIYQGRPIHRADLGPATIVGRNTIVTVIYRSPGLEMRAEGRALDGGGLGEAVRVLNLDSRLTVSATVAAPSVVEVRH